LLFLQVVGVQVAMQRQHRLAPAPNRPLGNPEQLRRFDWRPLEWQVATS
jgi:hypothetical protein